MKVLILGAGGMVGRKLTASIAATGEIAGSEVTGLILADIAAPAPPAGFAGTVETIGCDISAPGQAEALVARRPEMIFHLAAIVSGEAELDFDKGYRINLDGTRLLFDAIRAEAARQPYRPRLVFTSSIAVYGAPFHDRIDDEFFRTPQTSYGTQKAIGELLLDDYSRRGVFDGVGIRLPTICIRPGTPNKAASGFFSNILREPLVGKEAVLPVPDSTRHWHASPRSAVGFLRHAAGLPMERLGNRRVLNMPGLSRHGGRTDRGAAPGGRRQGGGADPARTRSADRAHRRRLAARLCPGAGRSPGLPRREQFRPDHPGAYRRRTRRIAGMRGK